MNTLNNKPVTEKELKQMVKQTKGKWFSAYVMTEKGLRRFHANTNVKRFNKGIMQREEKENLVLVYDSYAHGVRTINVNNLISFKCGKTVWQNK